MLRLYPEQLQRLKENGMLSALSDMEMPLTRVLFFMELEGFTVDKAALEELGEQFLSEIEKLHDTAIRLSGGVDFNLNSPKQLSEVLFERLGLPVFGRKGKTGVYSTSADVLEQLDHPDDRAASCATASSPNCRACTSRACPSSWTRRAACTRPSTRPPP